MAYVPSSLTISSWTVPISIVGTDTITTLDNTVNAIIDTDASSVKAHINTELAKIPTYLSTELTTMYNDLGAQINVIAGLTATASELNTLDGITSTTAELNKLDGYTGGVTELNYLKSLYDTGVTSVEFDLLDGLTATTTELNLLDGVTATTAELNYVDGVTSAIQTQLDAKSPLDSPAFTTTASLDGSTLIADSAKSLTTNGYQTLSNGLILQWGYKAVAAGANTVTFPITFPTACLNITHGEADAGTADYRISSNNIYSYSATQFTIYSYTNEYDFFWFAIGY